MLFDQRRSARALSLALPAGVLLFLLLAGCGGNAAVSQRAGSPGLDSEAPDAAAPALAIALPRQVSDSSQFEMFTPSHTGAEFADDLGNNRISLDGDAATLEPQTSEGSGLANTSYCIYRLRCYKQADTAELVLEWDGDAPALGSCWIGLPDWTNDEWTWVELPEENALAVDPALFASDNHTTFVAVVLTGDTPAKLAKISCNCTPDGVDAYNLFSPYFGNVTYLINMDGDVVHTWTADYGVKYSVYLLPNNHLLRTNQDGPTKFTGKIEEVDWDGNVLWTFNDFPPDLIPHHDIEPLPNGNVLAICWELVPPADAIAAGMNPSYVPLQDLEIDAVVEIQPTGPDSGDIVWEWRQSDHFIQDYDPRMANYGDVGMNSGLLDINFARTPLIDLVHANAVDYNAKLDQIALSYRVTSEIYIIDHSTTTEEAAGHSGGTQGKGGDFLYRWGNPQIYRHGSDADEQLFGQHDIEWIPDDCPGAGNLLMFDNQNVDPENGFFSSVVELVPPLNEDGSYSQDKGIYLPLAPLWTYVADPPQSFYSAAISSAQRLPDGNTLVCSGDDGWFFEVTPAGEVVWQYQNNQPSQMFNHTFRCDRYWLFTPWLELDPPA